MLDKWSAIILMLCDGCTWVSCLVWVIKLTPDPLFLIGWPPVSFSVILHRIWNLLYFTGHCKNWQADDIKVQWERFSFVWFLTLLSRHFDGSCGDAWGQTQPVATILKPGFYPMVKRKAGKLGMLWHEVFLFLSLSLYLYIYTMWLNLGTCTHHFYTPLPCPTFQKTI